MRVLCLCAFVYAHVCLYDAGAVCVFSLFENLKCSVRDSDTRHRHFHLQMSPEARQTKARTNQRHTSAAAVALLTLAPEEGLVESERRRRKPSEGGGL